MRMRIGEAASLRLRANDRFPHHSVSGISMNIHICIHICESIFKIFTYAKNLVHIQINCMREIIVCTMLFNRLVRIYEARDDRLIFLTAESTRCARTHILAHVGACAAPLNNPIRSCVCYTKCSLRS